MIKSEKSEYWKNRASRYSGFKWANDRKYLQAFTGACDLEQHHFVLDVGCGPGIVSKFIQPHVRRVIGMDNSREMLSQCDGALEFNLMLGDCADNPFPSGTFDRVLARNVFHHMITDLKKGFQECFRVLKPGGKIIIGERVPPSDRTEAEYREMLKLKDQRHIFTLDKLLYFLVSTGFVFHRSFDFWITGFSVADWLSETGLDDDVQDEIWKRHVNGSPEFKEDSHMRMVEDEPYLEDCVINLRNLVIVGIKT